MGKDRGAPAQGTLRAFEEMNQIRRVQSRVRSGVPVNASGDPAAVGERLASCSGSSQAIRFGAGSETCCCAGAGTGMAETGCGTEAGLAAQHGILHA